MSMHMCVCIYELPKYERVHMSLTRVTLGVGWEAEVGVGESRGKEEIQAKRKEKKKCTHF